MRKRTLAAAAALLMLAAVVANLLMMSTTAQPIEQDEAVTEKLAQTYVTRMPEPVIRQEEPERDMSVWTEAAAYIAKTVYGEAVVCGTTERAAVVWCILNRADDARDATPAGEELDTAKKNMEKYADYRTYLSFDMQQIIHCCRSWRSWRWM